MHVSDAHLVQICIYFYSFRKLSKMKTRPPLAVLLIGTIASLFVLINLKFGSNKVTFTSVDSKFTHFTTFTTNYLLRFASFLYVNHSNYKSIFVMCFI